MLQFQKKLQKNDNSTNDSASEESILFLKPRQIEATEYMVPDINENTTEMSIED